MRRALNVSFWIALSAMGLAWLYWTYWRSDACDRSPEHVDAGHPYPVAITGKAGTYHCAFSPRDMHHQILILAAMAGFTVIALSLGLIRQRKAITNRT